MTGIIITERPQNIDSVYSEQMKARLEEKLDMLPPCKSADEFFSRADEMKNVDVIFSTWGMLRLSKEQIQTYLPKLRAVFYAAGTVQYFASPFIECGVKVFSAWAANGVPVAEMAASLILLSNKGFFARRVRARSDWHNDDPDVHFPGNYGTKIGLLGAGMIGKGVISNLRGKDLEIYVFDPFLPDEKAKELGVTKASLDFIFEHCNVISNHLANNADTVGMINKRHFDLMGAYATFINTGRGAQVVESDMIAALKEVPTRTAILDVTDPTEPPIANSELYKMENVILTPHICGSIGNEYHRLAEYMFDEFVAYVSGQPQKYEVTAQMLKTMA